MSISLIVIINALIDSALVGVLAFVMTHAAGVSRPRASGRGRHEVALAVVQAPRELRASRAGARGHASLR